MSGTSPSKWAPEELKRFYRAFHKYGSDFYKVSKMVGGGKAPEMCAALWRRHQSYLDKIDKKFQTEGGFLAIVRGKTSGDGTEIEIPLEDNSQGLGGDDDGLSDAELTPADVRASRAGNLGDSDGEADGSDEVGAAEVVVAMASPGKPLGQDESLAGTRMRRTPKRPGARSPGGRSPGSNAKRSKATKDEDIYEYYDDTMANITESARKRRAAQKRLDFGAYQPAPTRRREEADEKGGIFALLALAEASGGGESSLPAGMEGAIGHRPVTDEETAAEESEDELAAMLDDDDDEDYKEGRTGSRGGRRTPYSTPAKGRRPGSSHTTPRRSAGRAVGSPSGLRSSGFGSPAWLGGLGGSDNDLMADFQGHGGEMSYLASPGLPTDLPGGVLPSPKNPMPRQRRRKNPPERHSFLISPLKSLFSRRQTLGGSTLLAGGLSFPGATPLDETRPAATPAEEKLRHCLGARMRRWCIFEFFYSAIDRPWFMDNTLGDVAAHVGLPAGVVLTRKQWNALRSSALGTPRRLSLAFLKESRAALEAHRAAARHAYTTTTPDPSKALLPRALAVGQRVIARHPATRQLHDGSVLTAAPNNYRVQFDRRELGVERVKDTEVMPSEPWENLPVATLATRPKLFMAGRPIMNGRPVAPLPSGPAATAITDAAAGPAGSAGVLPSPPPPLPQRVTIPDPQIMAELATSLDRKEALLAQLRQMNDEASTGMHNDPVTGTMNGVFSQTYNQVSQKLKEVNAVVQAKLAELERGAGAGSALLEELSGAIKDGQLAPELLAGPITAHSLAAATLKEARSVVQTCRQRLAAEAALKARAGGTTSPAEGEPPKEPETITEIFSGPLANIIEGAVWSLVTLQQGSDRLVPAAALVGALDSCMLVSGVRGQASIYCPLPYLFCCLLILVVGLVLLVCFASASFV